MYQHKDGMIYDPEDGQTIATMHCSATPEQAALLAAAPEMLNALDGMVEAATHGCVDIGRLLHNAREAINSARPYTKAEETPHMELHDLQGIDMKTHFSLGGWCLRWKWRGKVQPGDEFVGYGRLVKPNGHYDGCEYVAIYARPGVGYGYEVLT